MPVTPELAGINCVLGFDFGRRRIGVAVGNTISGSATALGVVGNGDNGPDWPRIDVYYHDWHPDLLLVGLPLTLDDTEQEASRGARAFAQALGQRCQRPVELVDERFTSIAASQRFAEQRRGGNARRKDHKQLDAMAAAIIVEQWLAARPAIQPATSPESA